MFCKVPLKWLSLIYRGDFKYKRFAKLFVNLKDFFTRISSLKNQSFKIIFLNIFLLKLNLIINVHDAKTLKKCSNLSYFTQLIFTQSKKSLKR